MKNELSKATLYALFSGQATPLQKKLVAEWLRQDGALEQYYYWLETYESENLQALPDTQAALDKYMASLEQCQRLPSAPAPAPAVPARPPLRRYGWMAAAVAVLCVCAGLLFQDRIAYRTIETAYGEVQAVTLPDGSRVTLNARSSLRVPRFGFGPAGREVFLSGEAEFVIRHLPDGKRFVVHTPDQMQVEVLGTEFGVYSRARKTKVALRKGSVRFSNPGNRRLAPVVLVPGQVLRVDTAGRLQVRSESVLQPHFAWKDKRFVFEYTTLQQVTEQVYERFGVRVVITDEAVARRAVTGTFRAATADELLEALGELMQLRIVSDGRKTLISPL